MNPRNLAEAVVATAVSKCSAGMAASCCQRCDSRLLTPRSASVAGLLSDSSEMELFSGSNFGPSPCTARSPRAAIVASISPALRSARTLISVANKISLGPWPDVRRRPWPR